MAEVGEALLKYLRRGRPETDTREIFIRTRAPLSATFFPLIVPIFSDVFHKHSLRFLASWLCAQVSTVSTCKWRVFGVQARSKFTKGKFEVGALGGGTPGLSQVGRGDAV